MGLTADQVIVDVVARLDGAERDVKRYGDTFERSSRKVVSAAGDIERSTARTANATRNLGRQVSDIGTQLAGGQSPFLIIAQQAPQVADALADTGGRAAKVATFFAGPWGAALLAAASVAGVLASELINTAGATEDLMEKLEKSEREARAADDAQAKFSGTLLGAAKAAREMNEALTKQNQSQLQVAQSALAAAEAVRQTTIQNRQRVADQLREQLLNAQKLRDDLKRGNPLASDETDRANLAAMSVYSARITRLQADYATAQEGVANAISATVQAQIPLLNMQAADKSESQVKITQQHSAALDRLKASYERAAIAANKLGEAGRAKALAKANSDYVNAQAAENDRFAKASEALAASRRKPRKGRTPTDQDAFAQSLGLGDYDAYREKFIQPILDATEGQAPFERLAQSSQKFEESLRGVKGSLGELTQDLPNVITPMMDLFDALEAEAAHLGLAIEDIFARGFGRLGDEIGDAIVDARSLGDAFSQVSRRIISDLIAIAVRQAIVKPLVGALGGGFSGAIGSLFARASGGYVSPGQMVRVNESAAPGRVEGFRPTGSGEVIPLGRMAAAQRGGGGVSTTIHQSFDLRGAVVTEKLYADMQQIALQGGVVGGAVAGQQGGAAALNSARRPRLPGAW